MRASLIAVAIAMSASLASAQGTQDFPNRPPLMFEVAARGYLASGRTGSMAGDSAVDRLESYVWADQTLCGMGAGDQPPAATPWLGWHFTGTVLADVPGEMTVRIEWRRMWENGARSQSGAGGTQTIKLRNGERVELDRVAAANTGGCGTVEARLEAAVTSRAPYLVGVTGVRGGVGAGARGGAAGRGTGRGAGVGAGTASGGGTTAVRGGGAGAGGGGVSGTGVQGTTSTGRGRVTALQLVGQGSYDAEIWLVHKKPDGTEVVQQQTVRFGANPKPFVFPPEEVAGGGGPITVDIRGSLQLNGPGWRYYNFATGNRGAMTGQFARTDQTVAANKSAASPETPATVRFMLSIARHAKRTTPFIDTRGATDVSVEMPKPGDVLSFELPPLQKATEDLLKGHTFSIRVRLTEVK
jgi:hypothetical protein